jgi:methionine biosynthesis protein MetW
MLRIGRRAIVSFPNFGHWRVRSQLLLSGRMPKSINSDCGWYDTPNIHLCTISDFAALAKEVGALIEQAVALDRSGVPISFQSVGPAMNVFGAQAIFLLRRVDARERA